MRTLSSLLGASLIVLFGTTATLRADDKVIVHEWGTFTCLQDEHGHFIGGINVDDEPVPAFVFGWGGVRAAAGKTVFPANTFGLPPYYSGKGWMPGDQDVTMRLETPVIYFYPPKGHAPQSVPPLGVQVDFQAGFLSQFYPYAEIKGSPGNFPYTILKDQRLSEVSTNLTWKGVRLGSTAKPVETDDKVWTTPREVNAPLLEVKAPDGWNGTVQEPEKPQAERFLFYRGVGHLDSPVFVASDGSKAKGAMEIVSTFQSGITDLDAAWIVEIRPDGTSASRPVTQTYYVSENGGPRIPSTTTHLHGGFTSGGHYFLPNFSAAFAASDFSAENLTKLKASMRDALVKEGLYPDEASAMLRTWELSYFKSPGLRFFYIVPRAWVDKVLPLKITGAPTDITRVMVGRIELISDTQKATLTRLAAGPCPDLAAIKAAANNALDKSKLSNLEKQAYYDGEKPLGELGIAIPPLVQDYLSLGRFRDALIVHEQQQHPSATLAQFIKDNGLAQELTYRTIPASGSPTKEP